MKKVLTTQLLLVARAVRKQEGKREKRVGT
jgi:hypothetical protein